MFSISAFAFSTIILLVSLLVVQARAPLVKVFLGGTLNDLNLNQPVEKGNDKHYAFVGDRKNLVPTIHTILAEYVDLSNGLASQSSLLRLRCRLFLVGSGYVAVKTKNTIGIFAVVLFNTYLVIVGCE